MTEEAQVAPEQEAAPETVQPEAEQVEAPEAAESTEGQTEDTGQPAEDDESEERPRKSRWERRKAQMDSLKTELEKATERADRLERELTRLNGAEMQPPKMDDFQDHDEYLAELSAFKAEQRMTKRQVEEIKRESEETKRETETLRAREAEEAAQSWAAQAEDARTRYADFDKVAMAPDVPITNDMAHLLGMSDRGADVAYYLGMNKAQAAELAKMPAPELIGAMRVLERLVPAPTPRSKTSSQAPEPVNPVKPKATAAKKVESMSMAEYRAAREAGKI